MDWLTAYDQQVQENGSLEMEHDSASIDITGDLTYRNTIVESINECTCMSDDSYIE